MAGGVGTRLYPHSRLSEPKQFLDILGVGKSLLRLTYERFLPIVDADKFIVVTNRRYRDLVLEHIPELDPKQVLCEPIARNTAPCTAYAAYTLLKDDPEAEMIVTPSDHFVNNGDAFRSVIEESAEYVAQNHVLMSIGVRPTHPETGYGYIQVSSKEPISRVKCFTEKPCLEIAQTFIQTGEFYWNTGIFVWRVCDIVAAFEKYMPEQHYLFESIMEDLGTEREEAAIERVLSECRPLSIDYGVMERAEDVYVRVGEFGWSDIGTWGSIYQHSRKDKYANSQNENAILYDTRNCVVSLPKNKVAVVSGLKDYIIVDTEDTLLICPRSEEQSIRKFIDEVKYKTGDKFI